MTIIISKGGKKIEKLKPAGFGHEESLQRYIYDHPDSIPLDIRLLILAREFPTDTGPIDAIGTDQNGKIYVIETKLSKNPDKRTVVAQVLDYGASLWNVYHSNPNQFFTDIDDEIKGKSGASLDQRLKDFFGIGDDEVKVLLENVKQNLKDGSFKFVVLMDKLNDKLKDLVTFINQKTQFTIYVVEMEFYKYEDFEILIPKLYGAEVRKDVGTAAGSRRNWDEKSFFEQVRTKKPEIFELFEKIYEWSQETGKVEWGTGPQNASFVFKYNKNGNDFSVFTVYADGELRINYDYMRRELPTDVLTKFHKMIAEIPTVSDIPADFKGFSKARVEALTEPENLEKFKNAVLWLKSQIVEQQKSD